MSRNFARKWRPKHFDTIVGQELTVRMLKNSLYLNQFFPVYLFSGQRGCGKTTTARIFAAALNCELLDSFQKDPKHIQIPCLNCRSCNAMADGTHADFIEIDAASHTGVDNVRMIIEAAALLPSMGRKKIYLIDEAHMLSKAAFNAFLKILEEPPVSVVFMLATTDPEKIIETVRSRCFQLFFTSLPAIHLVNHLKEVCEAEVISFEETALYTIVRESEGSARDALNLLEQVRFGAGAVTQEAVIKVLGHMSEHQLLTLFEYIIEGNVQNLLHYLQEIHFEQFTPLSVWKNILLVIRTALMMQCGITDNHLLRVNEYFITLVQRCSYALLSFYLETMYQYELLLAKTTVQHGMLELLFIKLASAHSLTASSITDSSSTIHKHSTLHTFQSKEAHKVQVKETREPTSSSAICMEQDAANRVKEESGEEINEQWQQFIEHIEQLSDPLLISIFKQGVFDSFDPETEVVTAIFSQDSQFFGEWLTNTEQLWSKSVQKVWGAQAQLKTKFDGAKKVNNVSHKTDVSRPFLKKNEGTEVVKESPRVTTSASTGDTGRYQKGNTKKIVSIEATVRTKAVSISDKEQWPTANQLVDLFGGSVEEVVTDEKIT